MLKQSCLALGIHLYLLPVVIAHYVSEHLLYPHTIQEGHGSSDASLRALVKIITDDNDAFNFSIQGCNN